MPTIKCVVALCIVLFAGRTTAWAQAPAVSRGFLAVNVGFQPQSQTFTAVTTPVISGENAPITVPMTVGSGPLFDASGGVVVWRHFGVGVGYSHFTDTESSTLTAQIPNPIIFNSPRTATAATGDLVHTESAVHLLLFWMMPVSEKVDVAIIVGPTFLNVKQDLVAGVTTTEGAPPFSTVSIAAVQVEEASKSVVALNVGTDLTARFTPKVGVGGFVRYLRAPGGNADMLVAGSQTAVSVSAGGFQLGFGLRLKF